MENNLQNGGIRQKLVEKKYLKTFILITSLFALWGFANDITNPMVAAFQTVMELSATKASMVQFAFYGGYATMAVPAALFIRKYSYKSGIVLGLSLYATGAFLFIPAAAYQEFTFFCLSLYILTFGLAFLETTANPFILSLGSKETSTRRLNLAQSFNPLGSITGMAIASFIVLPALVSDIRDTSGKEILTQLTQKDETTQQTKPIQIVETNESISNNKTLTFQWIWLVDVESKTENSDTVKLEKSNLEHFVNETHARGANLLGISSVVPNCQDGDVVNPLTSADKEEIRFHDLAVIRNPYVAIGLVVVVVLIIIILTKMPSTEIKGGKISNKETLKRLINNKIYREGVVTQMFYVAAQIMVWTFIIHYASFLGIDKATAQTYNIVAMVLFICGRFISTFLMKFFNNRLLLAAFGCGAAIAALGAIFIVGIVGLYCLVCISIFMSLMFPTIYGIALENVDSKDTTLGAAFLVMAIVGGALMPPLQGMIIDQKEIAGMAAVNVSFVLPLVCFIIVMIYGLRTYFFRKKLATR